jgi:hypothetical protein
MDARFRRHGLAVLLAVIAALLCRPGQLQAHPHFCGRWTSPTPPGGLMVFEFGTGDYIGNGMWRGPFVHSVSGLVVDQGIYELRMFTGTEGTICLKESRWYDPSTVGNVDLGARSMTLRNVTYTPTPGAGWFIQHGAPAGSAGQ